MNEPERDIPWVQCTKTPGGWFLSIESILCTLESELEEWRAASIQSQTAPKWYSMSSVGSSSISMCFTVIRSFANFGTSSMRVTDKMCSMLRDTSTDRERAAKRLYVSRSDYRPSVLKDANASRESAHSEMYRPGISLTWDMLEFLRDSMGAVGDEHESWKISRYCKYCSLIL